MKQQGTAIDEKCSLTGSSEENAASHGAVRASEVIAGSGAHGIVEALRCGCDRNGRFVSV